MRIICPRCKKKKTNDTLCGWCRRKEVTQKIYKSPYKEVGFDMHFHRRVKTFSGVIQQDEEVKTKV